MTLLSAQHLTKAFGPQTVLNDVSLSIEEGERIGLVGINGSGKSTLSKILAGVEEPDTGLVARKRDASLHYLAQEPIFQANLTAHAIVLEGLSSWSAAQKRHVEISAKLERGEGDATALLKAQADAAHEVERLGGWDLTHRAEEILLHLGIVKSDREFGTMSGGEKRRVALARILVARPDLAVLDEPTNHLDIETVEWLENYLRTQYRGALLLITHDRYFLDRVVTRTIELDQAVVHSYDGGYERFLEAKAERLALLERTEQNRQNFLRRELEWLRRGPAARTTKQKARIDRAEEVIGAAPLVPKGRDLTLEMENTRTGKTIVDIRDASIAIGGRTLVKGLSLALTKGERVGIVGPNGAGKTTLLKAILGQIPCLSGEIVVGKNTEIAYFDQTRSGLDPDKSILDNVAEGKLRVTVNGQTMDLRAWLERFLFDPSKQRQPVGALSGGERARVALAKLLLQPANLIVLDEPTNDLDLATLSALEELLVENEGTALVVTHDRYFLDRVATAVLAFEGDGKVLRYAGNFSMYRALKAEHAAQAEEAAKVSASASVRPETTAPQKSGKKRAITYGERIELEALPGKIETCDARIATIEAVLADSATYANAAIDVPKLVKELEAKRAESTALYAKWEELEQKKELEDGKPA